MIQGMTGYIPSPPLLNQGASNPNPTASGKALPPSDSAAVVAASSASRDLNISQAGQARQAADFIPPSTTRSSNSASGELELIDLRTREGKIEFGMGLIGQERLDRWSEQGLDVAEAAAIAVAEAFQAGGREALANQGKDTAGSSLVLNIHQLVMDSQTVPDWFGQEYDDFLAAIDDPSLKQAFEQGARYHASPANPINVQALNSYRSIAAG